MSLVYPTSIVRRDSRFYLNIESRHTHILGTDFSLLQKLRTALVTFLKSSEQSILEFMNIAAQTPFLDSLCFVVISCTHTHTE